MQNGDCGIAPGQLSQFLRAYALAFPSPAARADIIDNACVTADRVPVHGVVDGAITYAAIMHVTDNALKCFGIFGNIAVNFHICYMAGIGQAMVWRFNLYFLAAEIGK